MVPVSYNVRSLMVRKVTTFATAFGIALVVFVFAGSRMLVAGVNQALSASGRPDTAIVLRKGSDNELSSGIGKETLSLLRGHPQVNQAAGAGVIGELVVVITAERDGGGGVAMVSVRGTQPDGIAFRPEIKIVNGHLPKPGTNEVMVGKGIAGRFKGIAVGQHFDLRHNRPLEVVGEFSADGSSYESEVWGDAEVIGKSIGREGNVSSARVRLNSPADFDNYRKELEGDKRFAVKVMREGDYLEKQSEGLAGFLTLMGGIIAVMFSLAAMIGAAITMNGAVAHRSREIGTLRALGFSSWAILSSFVLEAMFLALIGGIIGSVLVLGMSLFTFEVMNFQTFSQVVIQFHAAPSIFVWSLVVAAGMGLLGGLLPAIRAARVSPVEAMRA